MQFIALRGPRLVDACRKFPAINGARCPTGQARITPGFDLPARFVIHTVGPIWGKFGGREDELLRDCYRNSLALGVCAGVQSIAFPAISCGVYGFPLDRAAEASVASVMSFLEDCLAVKSVALVAFDRTMHELWAKAIDSQQL